jgi:DNA-binding transcriptional LysR family regulator
MKTGTDWTDLAYFAAVAGAGGLARAAAELGVSAATLSRRMTAFETALGRRLFQRGSAGYALTADGRALAERIRGMDQVARQVALWREEAFGPVRVRLSAGAWTALDLAERLEEYWSPAAAWVPEFVYCDLDLDIGRREVDIGVRNRRPDRPWLAGRRIGSVDYAAYAAHAGVEGWIGPSWGAPLTPSVRWVVERHGDRIATTANNPHLAAALARAGVGRVVLPTFMGDRMSGLERVSETVAELRSEQWLVSHHEARADPPIRAALDAVAGYLEKRDS